MSCLTTNVTEKTKGLTLDVFSSVEKSIVFSACLLCLTHALYIPVVRVNGGVKYALSGEGKCLKQPVGEFLRASGVDLSNVAGLQELQQF